MNLAIREHQAVTMTEPTNAILVGISGPSSSGKTTLARLLRDIFANVFILHEDDFYKTDKVR